MFRPVAAGLMCLGIVTLGVAMSHGQDEEDSPVVQDLIVIEGNVRATAVQVEKARETPPVGVVAPASEAPVAIEIGSDAGLTNTPINGRRQYWVKDGYIVVADEEGKTLERYPAGGAAATPAVTPPLTRATRVTRLAAGPQMIDSQTREMLDKMAAGLKDQIQKLESEGKQDEAQQKKQSLRAIESLLQGHPHVRSLNAVRRPHDPKLVMEEIKKLHARRAELIEKSSKLPEGGDRQKLEQEFVKVNQEIAEAPQFGPFLAEVPQDHGMPPGVRRHGGTMGGAGPLPGSTGWPWSSGVRRHGGTVGGGDMAGFTAVHAPESAGMALERKSDALSQAAAQLKASGLDEQAQPLLAQAEEFRAKAQKLMQEEAQRDRAQGAMGMGGGMMGGPPGLELHRSIRELQEQIQQLRNEVGELRELLQRK